MAPSIAPASATSAPPPDMQIPRVSHRAVAGDLPRRQGSRVGQRAVAGALIRRQGHRVGQRGSPPIASSSASPRTQDRPAGVAGIFDLHLFTPNLAAGRLPNQRPARPHLFAFTNNRRPLSITTPS